MLYNGPLQCQAAFLDADVSVRHAGNAPTLMAMRDLRKVAPMWVNVSHAIFDDKEAHEARTQLPHLLGEISVTFVQCAFLRQDQIGLVAFYVMHCHASWVPMGHA